MSTVAAVVDATCMDVEVNDAADPSVSLASSNVAEATTNSTLLQIAVHPVRMSMSVCVCV